MYNLFNAVMFLLYNVWAAQQSMLKRKSTGNTPIQLENNIYDRILFSPRQCTILSNFHPPRNKCVNLCVYVFGYSMYLKAILHGNYSISFVTLQQEVVAPHKSSFKVIFMSENSMQQQYCNIDWLVNYKQTVYSQFCFWQILKKKLHN